MKVLAIDIGTKVNGLAFGYSGSKLTIPYKSVDVVSVKKDVVYFVEVIKKEKIEEVVMGLPVGYENHDTNMSKLVYEYKQALLNSLLSNGLKNIKVVLINESLSSKEAESILIEQGVYGKNNRKNMIDSLAAKIILDDYFNGSNVIE